MIARREDPPTDAVFAVELSACEWVVDGGTRRTTWCYFDGQEWQSVKDHPEALFVQLDRGPGVLWETQATLRLKTGTWLQRIERFPSRAGAPTDPMAYLRRQVRTRRYDARYSYYVVSTGGRLRLMKRKDAPTPLI